MTCQFEFLLGPHIDFIDRSIIAENEPKIFYYSKDDYVRKKLLSDKKLLSWPPSSKSRSGKSTRFLS